MFEKMETFPEGMCLQRTLVKGPGNPVRILNRPEEAHTELERKP